MISSKNILEACRKKQGLSQTRMADRLGISRARLQRIEKKEFPYLTWKEWKLLRSVLRKDLDFLTQEMAERISPGQSEIQRYSLEKPAFRILLSDGISLNVLTDFSNHYFAGCFILAPGKEIPPAWIPRTNQIFWVIVQGKAELTLLGENIILKSGQQKSVQGGDCLGFRNADSKNELKALILTSPSFIRIVR